MNRVSEKARKQEKSAATCVYIYVHYVSILDTCPYVCICCINNHNNEKMLYTYIEIARREKNISFHKTAPAYLSYTNWTPRLILLLYVPLFAYTYIFLHMHFRIYVCVPNKATVVYEKDRNFARSGSQRKYSRPMRKMGGKVWNDFCLSLPTIRSHGFFLTWPPYRNYSPANFAIWEKNEKTIRMWWKKFCHVLLLSLWIKKDFLLFLYGNGGMDEFLVFWNISLSKL